MLPNRGRCIVRAGAREVCSLCAKALESLVQPMFGIMSARLRGYSNSPTIECSMPVITHNSP
ncbi:hypothetical protein PT2222_40453 [Paraburkholderia tropica]